MTYYVETCHPDIYTIVYKIDVVLLTDVFCLYCICYQNGVTEDSRIECLCIVSSGKKLWLV